MHENEHKHKCEFALLTFDVPLHRGGSLLREVRGKQTN